MKHNGKEKYKILIYLNNVENGGTIFYEGEKGRTKEKVHVVKNQRNRLVLFDINLEHESEKFRTKVVVDIPRKKAIGFRLIDKGWAWNSNNKPLPGGKDLIGEDLE
jgi:hypothetical protein